MEQIRKSSEIIDEVAPVSNELMKIVREQTVGATEAIFSLALAMRLVCAILAKYSSVPEEEICAQATDIFTNVMAIPFEIVSGSDAEEIVVMTRGQKLN